MSAAELWKYCVDGDYESAELLLNKRAEAILLKDDRGWTALMYACHYGYCDLISLMLERRAPVDAQNKKGRTAFHVAISALQMDAVEELLCSIESPVSRRHVLNIADFKGQTPMHYAALMADDWLAQSLVIYGAAVTEPDRLGRTPLHYAAMGGVCDLVALFVEYGSPINHADKEGNTALHYAVVNASRGKQYDLICQHLILNGADPNATNRTKEKAFDLASPFLVATLSKSKQEFDLAIEEELASRPKIDSRPAWKS